MAYNSIQKSLVDAFRDAYFDRHGAPGSIPERSLYNAELVRFIIARPDAFGSEHVESAKRVLDAERDDVEGYGVFSRISDFFGEAVNQSEELNPFSERNRTGFALLLVGSATAVAIAFLLIKNQD